MIGRTLSHYRILAEISRGGMGIVYRALDLNLDREVALKVLQPDLVADPEIGLTLVVADRDQQIQMGYGQYPEKLSRLTALKRRLAAGNYMHDFASLDVSDLERIVVAPVQTPSSGSGDQQRS